MKIVLFRDVIKGWRFRVVARNHKIIAQSEGYQRKGGALNAICVLRRAHLFELVEEDVNGDEVEP